MRNRKAKLWLVLLLAVTMLVAACSDKQTQNNESGTNAGGSDRSDAPVQLTWFSDVSGWNPPSTWNVDPNTVTGAITENTGLTFTFDIPAQDAGTKLSLALVSNNKLPDIMSITDGTLIKKLIDADKVWKLDEFLEKYSPSSPLFEKFPEDIKQALIERDGGWYAYPSHMDSLDAREIYPPSSEFYADAAKYRNNGAIMFNEEIMEMAGLTVDDLRTEDDVMAAFEKVKGLTYDGAPVIPLQINGRYYFDSTLGTLMPMFGAMPVDKDGNYRDIILAPESKHAIKFLNEAYKRGYMDPGQMTIDDAAVKEVVKSGRVFAFIGNTANTGFTDENAAASWISPGPLLSNQGTKPVMGRSMKAGTGWMNTLISKTAEHPERIAKWLDFMTSHEGLLLNYYGFEGIGYTFDENGHVVQTEQGLKDAAEYSTTGVFAFWPFHHIAWHDYATAAPTSKRGADSTMAMQVQTAFGKAAVIYDSSPLQMPSDFIPAGSKLANAQLEIDTFVESQVSRMIMADDEATFEQLYEEMIRKVKEMGLDEIDAKINEQFQKQQELFGVKITGVNS